MFYLPEDVFKVVFDFAVGETKFQHTGIFYKFCSYGVILLLLRCKMICTVQFNADGFCTTEKIKDVFPKRMLSTPFQPVELLIFELIPEYFFGWRFVEAKCLGK